MLFSTISFLYFVFPCSILLYFILREKYRNYFLLIVSFLFYAWGEPKFVFVMGAVIMLNYFFALFLDHNRKYGKVILFFDILLNLSVLFFFKYFGFTIKILNFFPGFKIPDPAIVLPIGISFFIFQAMSYVIDVYRKTVSVQKNPFYLGLYIAFFPQLIAGPIVRYQTIEEQIENRAVSLEKISYGIERFIWGLSKKIIVANNMAVVADYVFGCASSANTSVGLLWIGSIAYSFQIFFDFSGYSDMAIGLGKIFGFDFLENFNFPYSATSITDFWRRWHISLSSWFRDYVYIPLGGNRKGLKKQVINLFIVWVLTGIWHGASFNFIFWGMIYFLLLVMEKIFSIPEKVNKSMVFKIIYCCFTLLCVNFCWVLFRSATLLDSVQYILGMVGTRNLPVINDAFYQYISEYALYFVFAAVYSMFGHFFSIKMGEYNIVCVILKRIFLAFLLIWSVSHLVLGAHNPFIYFHF